MKRNLIKRFIVTGVCLLANFLKKFNALLSQDVPPNGESDLSDSLEVHSNIVKFASNDDNAPLELIFGNLQNVTHVNPSKLKGHSLSPHTMRNSLPSILLQTYANPCLYWLHLPAFYILLSQLKTPDTKIFDELEKIKRIFSSEFVTRQLTVDDQDTKKTLDILNSINIPENEELANILLTSILPFVFCYFNVVFVMKDQVSCCINVCMNFCY